MSLPEVLLWNALRANGQGLRFRRQHSIKPYIIDFYCAAARLVVEVDGISHDMGDHPQRDVVRETALRDQGYKVIRLLAADVLKDATSVAESVVRVAAPLRQSLRDRHLPTSGEDR